MDVTSISSPTRNCRKAGPASMDSMTVTPGRSTTDNPNVVASSTMAASVDNIPGGFDEEAAVTEKSFHNKNSVTGMRI
eukprot:scaffold13335_cov149-Amphora_coffeaeformis.AAC.2